MLRAARLAAEQEGPAAELERLRAAVEAFPAEVSTLYALVDYGRRHPLSAEERRTMQARLLERLADAASPLSAGVVQRIAVDPAADEESLLLIADGVTRRLAGAEDAKAGPWLAVLAQVQTRLGRLEEAKQWARKAGKFGAGSESTKRIVELSGLAEKPGRQTGT